MTRIQVYGTLKKQKATLRSNIFLQTLHYIKMKQINHKHWPVILKYKPPSLKQM